MTSLGTGNEVDVLGKAAFYSQYDWLFQIYVKKHIEAWMFSGDNIEDPTANE